MDLKSKILLVGLVIMVFLMLVANYYRIFVLGDYLISREVECEPLTETCLSRDTDEGEVFFYKIEEAKAYTLKNAE